MKPNFQSPTNTPGRVSDFYNWSRDYWIEISKSNDGKSSNMLSFGLWENSCDNFYHAQIALHDFCMSHFTNIPDESHGLEIGCGIGGNALRLTSMRNICITGLDISPSQLDLAKQNAILAHNDRVRFIEGSSMKMPFGDANFDFSFCIESSFHYASIDEFAVENARILKHGSTALIADITCSDASQINFKHDNHFRSHQDIMNAFEDAGFEIVELHRIGPTVFNSLYSYVSGLKTRSLLHRYWTSVLRNYAELSRRDVMGYDVIIAKKK